MDYPEHHYEQIKASTPGDLKPRVLAVLQEHIGRDRRISRRDLVITVFGHVDSENLSNSTYDRQIRATLDELQDEYPILSTSGGGGYFYAESAAEINRYAAELDSRAKKLLDKSRRLVRQARRFQSAVQLSLPV